MNNLRVVFAGTPAFALPSLAALLAHPRVAIAGAYTQPDRAAGRGRTRQASPVKLAAQRAGLRIEQPESWRDGEALQGFAALDPDLLVVAAYGLILPPPLLAIPRLGAINIHASLLPRWRGAAPIERAIMAGDAGTGVTIMRVVAALDAGPMLHKKYTPIAPADTGGSLRTRLAELGASALIEALDGLLDGTLCEAAQDPAAATYARKIERSDRVLHWDRPARELERTVRALHPSPLATTKLAGIAVNIWSAEALTGSLHGPAGTLLRAAPAGIEIACGDGCLRITELQPPGKRCMTAREFVNGYRRHLPV